MNVKKLLGSTPTANVRGGVSPDALKKAIETANERVPERERAELFLQNHIEPPLAQLLERRAEILRGLNADADLDTRAASELARGDGPAQQSPLNALTLPALEREIAVRRRAIAMQGEVVARARVEWSAVVCDQLRPVHRQQVERIWAALQELSAALTEHQEFVYQLRDADVANFSANLRPMFFTKDSMQLSDPSSSASSWLNDAKNAGLLD